MEGNIKNRKKKINESSPLNLADKISADFVNHDNDDGISDISISYYKLQCNCVGVFSMKRTKLFTMIIETTFTVSN